MAEKEIKIAYQELSYEQLSENEQDAVDAARAASYRAYAPYSRFSVGAAILLDSGEIVAGSNQENVAYPSGMCAERTAAYYAHSRYPDSGMQCIAIVARDTNGEFSSLPISPCGACRQALLEYELLSGEPIAVLLVGGDKICKLPSVKSLLPLAFDEFK